ncbi:MAG TPA: hypothetical protein VHW25_00735 [Steroidobacteraceae bacterium]|jgi:hypothetical protein|nr:hypothetical protein [Steroidobacteraceae bacterium]
MEPVSTARFPVDVLDQPGTPVKSTASWSAIIAGAFVAIAVSLVLFALGSALGFASISAWEGQGASMTTFAVTTAIWLIVMQWLSSAVGGYVAGRLRSRWMGTHPHEIFFRDTAHGLVTWAVATVVVAALLASSVLSALSGGAHVAATVAAGAEQAAAGITTPTYLYGLDRLLRPADASAPVAQNAPDVRPEVTHVIVQTVASNGTVSDADRSYLASLVAARTGASPQEAQTRVNDFISAANQARDNVKASAEAARKAAAKMAIFTALALVIGAFIACLTAALGGKLRDEHP